MGPNEPEYGRIEPGHIPAGYLTERPPSPWGSRAVHWALTAAVLAAVVCLVGWPWPTLYALGLLAGASILLAGIRLLLTERREPPADDHTAGAPAMRCCVCGGTSTVYENCYGNWFCWPSADCPCGETPCVRTGINDPAVSSAAAEGPTCQCAGVGFGGRGDCPVHDGPTTADASGRAPETARQHPDASAEQPADQGGDHPDDLRNRLRDAVAEAIMCGDHACLTSHHLPTIAQLLGGVGLLKETAPTTVQVTPPLTGPMPATDTPTCGTNLPSTDGIPCGEPAAWHIRWAPGAPGDATFPASLACHAHMDQLARTATWYERHAAGPDCGTRTANWQTDHCTPAEEA
jgi:hypothetical protein